MNKIISVLLSMVIAFPSYATVTIELPDDVAQKYPDAPRKSTFDEGKEAFALEKAFKDKKLEERTDRAIDRMISKVTRELRKRGFKNEAKDIETAWTKKYKGFIFDLSQWYKSGRPIGDHPAIQWMFSIHANIHAVLGERLCNLFRLHDLWYFAHTIPVVFTCKGNTPIDLAEYSLHYVDFMGRLSFWVSWGICVGVTLGAGAIGMICYPVGYAVEYLMFNYLAPKLSPLAFKIACHEDDLFAELSE